MIALAGRQHEQGVLRAALAAALAGRGSLVLIGGEAGIGKTALAEALGTEATARGGFVLTGRCYDFAETPAYGPWLHLFEHYRPTADEASGGMPPHPPAFAEPGRVGEVASPAALFRQVLAFLQALTAARPVTLLLDDLHWADPASLDLLRFLARSAAPLPLLILVTYRSDELTPRHSLTALLPALVREAGAQRLELGALDAAAIRALVVQRHPLPAADAARLVAYVQERTEGNALFVAELLRSLAETSALRPDGDGWRVGDLAQVAVPRLLRQVIDARVARLGAEGERLFRVAAIIGHEVDLDVWAHVAEADEEAVLDVVERAVGAHLVEEAGAGAAVRFAHALIREALYEGVLQARRRRVHRRVAEILAAAPDPDVDAVAHHFQRAGDGRAAEWLVRTGEQARRAHAWITAGQHYEAALAHLGPAGTAAGERAVLLLHLATLRRFQDPHTGVALLEEAERIAAEVGDRALVGVCRRWRGVLRAWDGDEVAGLAELASGVALLEALAPAERTLRLVRGLAPSPAPISPGRGSLIEWLMLMGRYAEAAGMAGPFFAQAAAPVHEISGSAYGDGLWGLGRAHAAAGRVAEARALLARARVAFAEARHYSVQALMATEELRLVLAYAPERREERRALAATAEEVLARAGATLGDTPPPLGRLPLLLAEGDWAAIDTLRAQAPAWSRYGLWDLFVDEVFALLASLRGEDARAWAEVGAILPGGPATEPGTRRLVPSVAAQRLAVALALDSGDLVAARAWLEAHERWLAWSGAVLGRSKGAALRARYHRAAGDLPAAHAHAVRALAHATEPRQPLALLAAHRLCGELAAAAGRHAEADRHLRASLALADDCAAPHERALSLLALAELRVAAGDAGTARTLADEARALCLPLGARPALARAAAIDARLETLAAAPAYPAGLSAREVEVIRLVAQGLTNPQVAARLSLSRRTVEQHLRSIYNKLGVPTRAAATHFAVTHGLA